MTDKIARVRWKMGQELLPDHFFAQEEALITDSIERFRMNGLPAYGVAKLKWNETLLDEGVFSIQTMTLVMPSGLLLDIPGNAVLSPFHLNIPGTIEVAVYCHVLHDTVSDEDIEEEWEASEKKAIPRVVYQIVLSSEQNHPDAFMTMKLAEFDKNPEGIWQASAGYIPPLLQTGTSPFLKKELDELSQVLEIFQYNLTLDAVSYLSGESLFSVRQCLKSVYRTQRFLANLDSQVHVHPYYVYEVLQNLYAEVCFYKNTVPEHITSPYNHDKLTACFNQIIKPLREQMQTAKARSPYLPFEFKDGVHRIELPKEIREAKQVYFLVQKSHVNIKIAVENLKLASFSRLSLAHRMALQGIPIRKTDRTPFQHAFGPEVDFFLIIEGEEWDYALRELSVAFYHHNQFKDMEFYIYWR